MRNFKLIWIVFALALLAGCTKGGEFDKNVPPSARYIPESRADDGERRNVAILYSAGFNSLSNYLKEDIEELKSGYIPSGGRTDNVLLVFSKLPRLSGSYDEQTSPVLFRLYKDARGSVVSDTLKVWPVGTRAVDAAVVTDVLNYVRQTFPANGYGIIFSSHATGWMPEGYYSNPFDFEEGEDDFWGAPRRSFRYCEIHSEDGLPEVKSVGQEYANGKTESHEINIQDFAEAIPFKLDYLIFDACLMGGVEVAYALKDKASLVAFSQTEILAQGIAYKLAGECLLKPAVPMVKTVCSDYFEQYEKQTGSYRSATISLINTDAMDALAEVCATLFEKYRSEIASLKFKQVQCFGRNVSGWDRHWFFDLRDVIVKAGASDEDLASLDAVLSEAVVYCAYTPLFLSIRINTDCGLSMYLPVAGSNYLNEFYKSSIAWNDATALVK